MKRVLMLLSMVAIFELSSIIVFADDQPSDWAAKDVQEAIDANLVPEALQRDWKSAISRKDFCTLIVTLLENRGYEFDDTWESCVFKDTNDVNIRKVASLGIVKGKRLLSDGIYFDPEAAITRQEAATMLYRMTQAGLAAVIPAANSSHLIPHVFSDRELSEADHYSLAYSYIAPWARTGIDFCYNTGILSGIGNNRFDPNGTYTKEQSCITMLRLSQWASDDGVYTKSVNKRFLTYDTVTKKYGYKDINDSIVIPVQYDLAGEFTESGYAVVGSKSSDGGLKYQIIDGSGKVIEVGSGYEKEFDHIQLIGDTVASVQNWDKHQFMLISLPDGIIINDHVFVSDTISNGWYKYYALSTTDHNTNNIFEGSLMGYLNEDGHIAISADYTVVGDFYNNEAIALPKESSKPVLINQLGEVLSRECGIDLGQYEYWKSWGRYFEVRKTNGNSYGVSDYFGNTIVPMNQSRISWLPYGRIIATHEEYVNIGVNMVNPACIYDLSGKKLSKSFYEDYVLLGYKLLGLCFPNVNAVNGDGYYRLCDLSGTMITDKPMGNSAGLASDGGSAILYSNYIDPETNTTGLAINEGNWLYIIDDKGQELWKTHDLDDAEFVNGLVRITNTDGTIEYYTPSGVALISERDR